MIKLIFFDIDGTLIYHTHSYSSIRMKRYAYAITKAWGINVPVELPKYEGWIDRGMTWDVVSQYGIARNEFLAKLPEFNAAMKEYLEKENKEAAMYKVIPEAKELIVRLGKNSSIHLAVLTGNVETIAWWKLEHAGLKNFITFGIFGDEADSKVELGTHAIEKANTFFKTDIQPSDVVVIGDTPFDIECGKSMGVHTVGVATGRHGLTSEHFKNSGADMVVISLMDASLLNFLGIA